MTDRERKVMEMVLEALEWHVSRTRPIEKTTEAIEALRQALDHVPDTMKMLEPDMGIDRGAWDDVPDATKWVDELRGGDEAEQEPVAWISADTLKLDHIIKATIQVCRREPDEYYNVPLYTAPPSKRWVSLTDDEIWEWFESNTAITRDGALRIARAIEAKLKEKNT